MIDGIKVLLIGGTSHSGKSVLAKRLADETGCRYLSADNLARHPGRPWRDDGSQLPQDVVEYYSKNSLEELVNSVLKHYRQNVWPIVDAFVLSHLNNTYDPCLIFEGSSILPDTVHAAGYERVAAVWLTASDEVIANRIAQESQLRSCFQSEKRLIDSFTSRSLEINQSIMNSVYLNDQRSLDTSTLDSSNILKLFNAEYFGSQE